MAEISKLSGVAIADVTKVDAVLKADIANLNGLTIPSSGPAEAGALGHWLFGPDNTSYNNLTGGADVTEQGTSPTFTTNTVVGLDFGNALQTSIADSADLTMCLVFKATSNFQILCGTVANPGGGASLFEQSNSLLAVDRSGLNSTLVSTTVGNYYFAAVSLSSANTYVTFVGLTTGNSVTTGSSVRNDGNGDLGVGNRYYNGGSGNNEIAEFIAFDSAKTSTELDAIYGRSTTRMSNRGITLQ